MSEEFSIPFSRFHLARIIKNFIFFLFGVILCLPLLPDIGNYLFPLGKDIILKLLVELSAILAILYRLISGVKLNFKPHLKSNFTIPGAIVLFLLISALSDVSRPSATLNNPDFLSAYLVLLIPLLFAIALPTVAVPTLPDVETDSFIPYLARALQLQKENAQNEFSYFTRNYIYAGQIAMTLYQRLSLSTSPGLVDSPNYLEIAKQNFQRAAALSPNRQSIHTEWSRLLNLLK